MLHQIVQDSRGVQNSLDAASRINDRQLAKAAPAIKAIAVARILRLQSDRVWDHHRADAGTEVAFGGQIADQVSLGAEPQELFVATDHRGTRSGFAKEAEHAANTIIRRSANGRRRRGLLDRIGLKMQLKVHVSTRPFRVAANLQLIHS